MIGDPSTKDCVGPVLQAGPMAKAVIEAIQQLNQEVRVVDRGSYLRVLVPKRCWVTRAAIEKQAQRLFQLPGDLEMIMPAFKGMFSVSEEAASWEFSGEERGG